MERLNINDSSSLDDRIRELSDRQDIGVDEKYDASPFYNKKLEIRTKTWGSGRRTRTSIVNFFDIARALRRPPIYLARYMGLGVRDMFKVYREETEEFQICRAHSAAKLAGVMDKFIKKYVECYKCGSPETEVVIAKRSASVNLICGGCGFNSEVAGEFLVDEILSDHSLLINGKRAPAPLRRDFRII